MVLSIPVSSETEARLRMQAEAVGKEVIAYVTELVERAAAQASLEQILEPLRNEFAASETTDEQLVEQITAAQEAYRREQQKKSA
jgi:hypothetical protein